MKSYHRTFRSEDILRGSSCPFSLLIPILFLYLKHLQVLLKLLPIFKTANNGDASVSSGDTFQWLVKVENSLQSKQKLSLQP